MGFVFLTQQSVSLFLAFVYRSICWQMFFKIGVLKNLTNFTGKHLCLSLIFSNVADLICCNFIKKRLQHRFFPSKFAKFLSTPFFTEHLQWLLLRLPGPPTLCPGIFIFSCEFCEIFKGIIEHLRWLLLSVSRCKTSKYAMTATRNGLIV